jgi:hypothetical protein
MVIGRLSGVLWLLLALPLAAQDDTPALQRRLADLKLGMGLRAVEKVYPPARRWPAVKQNGGRVTRLRVERQFAKKFPSDLQVLWLGFEDNRLVEMQLIYSAAHSRKKSTEALAGDLALVYGEPRRANGKYVWGDRDTVLRVFNAEIPLGKQGVEFRTSIQIMERELLNKQNE